MPEQPLVGFCPFADRFDDVMERLCKIEQPIQQLAVDLAVLKEWARHLESTDEELKAAAKRSGGHAGGVWGSIGGFVGGLLSGLATAIAGR